MIHFGTQQGTISVKATLESKGLSTADVKNARISYGIKATLRFEGQVRGPQIVLQHAGLNSYDAS